RVLPRRRGPRGRRAVQEGRIAHRGKGVQSGASVREQVRGLFSSQMATTVSQIIAVNPATEELIASFDAFGPDEVEMALAEAHDAYLEWRGRPIAERAVPMRALARLLRERADAYPRLATRRMGKPLGEAKAEIEKCAWACEHFADAAARYLADEEIRSNARRSVVAFQPLG